MARIAKCVEFALLLSALFGATAHAATWTAATCNANDVQTALNAAVTGDTVVIPAGTCAWTTSINWTAPANVILQGAGNQTIIGGGDATVISDSYINSNPILNITTNGSGTVRITGITFQGGSASTGNEKYNGIVNISGSSQSIRIDHVHINSTTYSTNMQGAGILIGGCTAGVVDHSQFDDPSNSVFNDIKIYNQGTCYSDSLGVGDQSWAHATALGGSNFVFVEDNTFNGGAGNDCTKGGRFVWRHNTMNMTAPAPMVQTHPTGGGQRERGCRAWEIYSNSFTANSGNYINDAFWLSSGTGVIWGNSIPSSSAGGGTGVRSLVNGHEMRYDTTTYTQSAPPAGWGYCGTHQSGVASPWDQNTDSTGYRCIDQPGAGVGQLLVNDFPNVLNNSTGTEAWLQQALEPVYEWANAYSPVPNNPSGIWSESEPSLVIQNRDYYLGTTASGSPISFDGTSGVGSGLLSARPSTCTPAVAYWATDMSTLYQCSATNTWSAFYTPYTYPHPLTQGSSSSPMPPTNIQSTVH